MPRTECPSEVTGRAALMLLQLAAAQADIGPFARRGRETPLVAAGLYRAAAARSGERSRGSGR